MSELVDQVRTIYGYSSMERREDHDLAPYFPSFAYRTYLNQRRRHHIIKPPEVYLSLAITSGGYRRDESLTTGQVVDLNTDYGYALRQLFADHNVPSEGVVIPSELGAMRNASWGQFDFLMLWFHVMSGVSEQHAHAIEKAMMGLLGGSRIYGPGKWEQNELLSGISQEEAWHHYKGFTERYVSELGQFNYSFERQAVKRVVGALDNDLSLGGRAEKLWAGLAGVPYYELEVQTGHVPERLRLHTQRLHQLGAQAIRISHSEGPSMLWQPVAPNTPGPVPH